MTNSEDTLAGRCSRALAWALKSRLGTTSWRCLARGCFQFIELLGNFCFQIQVKYCHPLQMRYAGLPVFRFEPEKALEAILYVASKAQTDKYATLKILYLADKLHLERYGRFISGDYYHALKHGSTPMHSYDMLEYAAYAKNQCVIEGVREALLVGTKVHRHALTPRREPDLDVFSESDIECLNEVISRIENINPVRKWIALRADAHDAAWHKTRKENKNGRIDVERIAEQFENSDELIDYLRQA